MRISISVDVPDDFPKRTPYERELLVFSAMKKNSPAFSWEEALKAAASLNPFLKLNKNTAQKTELTENVNEAEVSTHKVLTDERIRAISTEVQHKYQTWSDTTFARAIEAEVVSAIEKEQP